MLSQHPNVLHKLREEILAVVGNSGNPTPDNLREMKYLRAVINGMSLRIPGYIINSPVMKKLYDCILLCEPATSLYPRSGPDYSAP